jgi:hypothetical protein
VTLGDNVQGEIMNEYDQRQYNLMKRCLEGFENSNLNLRVLIDSLRGLLNVLQEVDAEWVASFRREWWTLEQIYAVASDRGQFELSQADQDSVNKTIGEMKQLLASVMIYSPDQY